VAEPNLSDLIKQQAEQLARLRAELARLRRENERLRKALEAARRAGFRQAAPFLKGAPTDDPVDPDANQDRRMGDKGAGAFPRPSMIRTTCRCH
jgi:cell shape-determining protein MreC